MVRQNIVPRHSRKAGFLVASSPCSVIEPIIYKILTHNSDTVFEGVFSRPLIQKLHCAKISQFQLCNHFCNTSKSYTPETEIIKLAQM